MIIYSLFYFYIVAVIAVTLFPLPFQQTFIEDGIKYNYLHHNFVPFKSIMDTITHDDIFNIFIQLGGNILLLMPFGFFVPLSWKSRNILAKAFPIGFLFTFGIESSQFIISSILGFVYRTADIDDIILNCIGFVLGFYCLKICLYAAKKISPSFVHELLQ